MEKLKLRCPSCAKLYEVESADIQTSTPQFQCVACDTRFTFAFPPSDPQHILCRRVEVAADATENSSGLINAQGHLVAPIAPVVATALPTEWMMKNSKTCPKCGALSPRSAEECYACHVIFAKLEGLPTDPLLRAQPSLVRKWKMLVDDFENEDKHEDFIGSCQKLEALGFALSKYQDIKQAKAAIPFVTA